MTAKALYPQISPSLLLDFANVKALDPRITFTRTTTATYYNGVTTAKAEENLLLRSQDYSATWTVTNLTPVTGKTAPDSTSTATEFTAGAANATLTQAVTAIAGDYTFSVFLRRVTGTGNVDISAHSGGTWVTQTLTGTWTRFTVTQTLTAGSRTPGIRIVTSGDVIEVWGAQLEQRSAVTAYTPTTTQPITNYIPVLLTAASGVARFDHNPTTGESLGLLVEEQRTNLLTYSEEFDNAAWTKTRSSITANTIVAPDGTLTGDLLIADTAASTTHFANQSASFTSGVAYTVTLYAKQAGLRYVRLGFSATAFGAIQVGFFDLQDGVVTSTAGTVTTAINSVGNGWWRVRVTATATATASDTVAINLSSSGTSSNFTGNGYSGVFIWGAQLEAGAFPTSYIPTVAATVTRNADAASMTGTNFTSWFNQQQGSLYLDSTPRHTTIQYAAIIGNGASSTLGIGFFIESGNLQARVRGLGGGSTIGGGIAITSNTAFKAMLSYAAYNNAWAYNGANRSTGNTTIKPEDSVNLRIGSDPLGNNIYTGTIRKLSFYPIKLSDAELNSLTTV